MKNFKLMQAAFSVVLLVLGLGSAAFSSALIDPSLGTFARSANQNQVRVLILLNAQENLAKPERYDRANVVAYFKETARQAALPLFASWQNKELPGVNTMKAFWISHAVVADVTPEGLRSLARHPSVKKIYLNTRVDAEPSVKHRASDDAPATQPNSAYAFPSIGLDQLSKEKPDITGQGVIIGLLDTGVDGNHPALKGKVAAFYDGETKTMATPQDYDTADTHGTHVSGTVVGGNRANNNIGVAPDAKIVMSAYNSFEAILGGMQWYLDADKNPGVSQKIKAVGCSWNTSSAPDQEVFYKAIAAWEAAGILPIFSAGNFDPDSGGSSEITHPHEYPGNLTVGAYGADGSIANFSCRGPGHYHGQDIQKPDLSAPGVDVRSSVSGTEFPAEANGYWYMSGTSMAAPHVVGTAALLLQVNKNLNPVQLKEVLMKSVTPANGQTAGVWSADFGFGKLNAYNAVKMATTLQTDSNMKFLNDLSINPTGPSSLDLLSYSSASLGEVDGPQDQFEDTDSSRWLTAEQIYGNN